MSKGSRKNKSKIKPKATVPSKPKAETNVQLPASAAPDLVSPKTADQGIESQAARLADPDIPTTQRQDLATQIGRVTGNQYLQRVMAQANHLRVEPARELPVSVGGSAAAGAPVVQRADKEDPKLTAAKKLYKAIKGAGTDEDAVMEALLAHRGKGKALSTHYKKLSGETLKAALLDDLSGLDLFKAWTYYHGRLNAKTEAELLKISMKGAGTDDDLFWAVLKPYKTRSLGQRLALMNAYDRHGNLMTDIDDDFDGSDFTKAVSLISAAPSTPMTQAAQEAEAQATNNLCKEAVNWLKNKAGDPVYKNTAALFTKGRLKYKPMTMHHNNYKWIAKGAQDPRTRTYYFYGLKADNVKAFGPRTMGTISNDTVIVRGTNPGAGGQPTKNYVAKEEIANTMIHEGSHILVKSYKDLPETATKWDSLDRYKDEFRAYWIQPEGSFVASNFTSNALRAKAIRDHLVGKGPRESDGGYRQLRLRYFGSSDSPQSKKAEPKFKQAVDAHVRPDSYNLKNNAHLDSLYQLIINYPTLFTNKYFKKVLKFIKETMTAPERMAAITSKAIPRVLKEKVGNVVERMVIKSWLKRK